MTRPSMSTLNDGGESLRTTFPVGSHLQSSKNLLAVELRTAADVVLEL
jgi:hypothetical protein